ncbi:hypothetical protein [Paenibacillus cymbidii]|uniref:hypothetical protein n=1 Tax=Paenibacillus cymbidii TaxID=1639034 RepID=UPI00108021BF|nr:hypothetical protein [Paenibacillus cymbidii]
MDRGFMQLAALEGELKLSHKKSDFGLTVSTKELVLQKPHVNYYMKLANIYSIVPFQTAGFKAVTFASRKAAGNEISHLSLGSPHYRIRVSEALVHNRSGQFRIGDSQFIMPIHVALLRAIAEHGGMNTILTD